MKYLIAIIIFVQTCSCKKFVEVPSPKTDIGTKAVFEDSLTALSAISGIYSDIMQTQKMFSQYTTVHFALMSDEMITNQPDPFFTTNLTADMPTINSHWIDIYFTIYAANSVIDGTEKSSQLTESCKRLFIAEARFLRAFSFFYLTNIWGAVPLTTTTDYAINEKLARNSISDQYSQMISDLKYAEENLPSTNTNEKVRPTKWAAKALLSRIYLYTKSWELAEITSNEIITSNLFTPLPTLAEAFLKNNKEAIWQLKPVRTDLNTFEGQSIPASGSIPAWTVSDSLLKAFEPKDERKNIWIGKTTVQAKDYYYPYKYKIRTGGTPLNEYYTVFRSAEQLLIRAEAKAMLSKYGPALDDINIVRNRAGLPSIVGLTDREEILKIINAERRFELFCEWGNRWFDLRRSGKIDSVLNLVKGADWQATDTIWPIPQLQRNANPLLTQNQGFN